MSAEVRHEVNRVLVEGLDAFEQMVEQRDAALNERDHARDIACTLEQELAAANSEARCLREKAEEWHAAAGRLLSLRPLAPMDITAAEMLNRCAADVFALLVIPDGAR